MQRRYLKTIGIVSKEDLAKHNIITIEELIVKHGRQRLTKILNDQGHPITRSLEKRESVTRKNFPFKIKKCNSEKYQKSFLQQFLRTLEKEGLSTPILTTKATEVKNATCEICQKSFKNTRGVNQHKRMIHRQPFQT